MSNSISLFSFGESSIRTLSDESNQIWFVANDICNALGYTNPKKAIKDHVDEEDIKGVTIRDPLGKNPQTANAVNESGMYSLVLRSRKKEAKPFKRWVTSEVLPSIRKTGEYKIPYSVNSNDSLNKDQADELRDLLRETADKLPKEEKAKFMRQGWSKLKAHFGVSYRDIPQSEYSEALSIVSRHIANALEGEYIPAPELNKYDKRNLEKLIGVEPWRRAGAIFANDFAVESRKLEVMMQETNEQMRKVLSYRANFFDCLYGADRFNFSDEDEQKVAQRTKGIIDTLEQYRAYKL